LTLYLIENGQPLQALEGQHRVGKAGKVLVLFQIEERRRFGVRLRN
jgi:hypothetical protein